MIRTTAVIVNNETRSYLLKMFTTWDIVEDWMALAEPPGAGPGSAEPAVGNPADEAVPNAQMTGAKAPAAENTP
jgi:hypothetical protein